MMSSLTHTVLLIHARPGLVIMASSELFLQVNDCSHLMYIALLSNCAGRQRMRFCSAG